MFEVEFFVFGLLSFSKIAKLKGIQIKLFIIIFLYNRNIRK